MVSRRDLLYNLNNKNLFFVPNLTEGEGQVFGIGCKVFTIAGPVILYGIVSSWIVGLIYWIFKMFGVL